MSRVDPSSSEYTRIDSSAKSRPSVAFTVTASPSEYRLSARLALYTPAPSAATVKLYPVASTVNRTVASAAGVTPSEMKMEPVSSYEPTGALDLTVTVPEITLLDRSASDMTSKGSAVTWMEWTPREVNVWS